jgi:hypothetical protein
MRYLLFYRFRDITGCLWRIVISSRIFRIPLSIAKMLSGWNAFEISDIQDIQLNRRNPAIRCNNVALG